ncbi:hypothetical protein GCM10029992_36010 [Glycomyces albus]
MRRSYIGLMRSGSGPTVQGPRMMREPARVGIHWGHGAAAFDDYRRLRCAWRPGVDDRRRGPRNPRRPGWSSTPRRTWQQWRTDGNAPECHRLPNGQLRIHRPAFDAWMTRLKEHKDQR